MTSLANQLNQLRQKQNLQTHMASNLNASLIFDLKEAGMVTFDKIRELAIEGYHKLISVVPSIVEYQTILFIDKRVDRMRLTPSEQDKLSLQLQDLITLLSKAFLNFNTLRILEFLLRNYQVHKFEGEHLIISFLAYHSTGVYVKLLQNIDLSQATNKYFFLNTSVRAGNAFTRTLLCNQSLIDPSILKSYLDHYRKELEINANQGLGAGVFITKKMREQLASSPTLAFLTSMLSESMEVALKSGRKALDLKVLNLEMISLVLEGSPSQDQISSSLLLFSQLISLQIISSQEFLVVLQDLNDAIGSRKEDFESLNLCLCKLVVFAYQSFQKIEVTNELWKIVTEGERLTIIFGLNCSLLQFFLINYQFCLKNKKWNSEIENIMKYVLMNEAVLKESGQARTDVLVAILDLVPFSEKNKFSKKVVASIQKSVGDEVYKVLDLFKSSLKEEDSRKKIIEKFLEDSELFKVISLAGYSKTTLAMALQSSKPIKLKALEYIKELKTVNKILREKMFSQLKEEHDVEVAQELLSLNTVFGASLSFSEQEITTLFLVYTRFETSKNIQKIIEKIAQKNTLLQLRIDVFIFLSLHSQTQVHKKKSKANNTKFTFTPSPSISEEEVKDLKIISKILNEISKSTFLLSLENIFKLIEKGLIPSYKQQLPNSQTLSLFSEVLQYVEVSSRSQGQTIPETWITSTFEEGYQAMYEYQFNNSKLTRPDFCQLISLHSSISKLLLNVDLKLKLTITQSSFISKIFDLYLKDIEGTLETHPDSDLSNSLASLLDGAKTELDKSPKNLAMNSLLMLIRGTQYDQFQTSSFIKILQFLRFIISKNSGFNQFTSKVFIGLLKSLLTHKLEYESGGFRLDDPSMIKDLKSQLVSSPKEFAIFMKLLSKAVFRSKVSFEFEFLIFLESISVLDFKTKKSTVGKLLAKVLIDDEILESITGQDTLQKIQVTILKIIVKNLDSVDIQPLLKVMVASGTFSIVDSALINELKSSKFHDNLVKCMFENNHKIQYYESLEIEWSSAVTLITNLDTSNEKNQLNVIEALIKKMGENHPFQLSDVPNLLLCLRMLQSFTPKKLKVVRKLFQLTAEITSSLQSLKQVKVVKNYLSMPKKIKSNKTKIPRTTTTPSNTQDSTLELYGVGKETIYVELEQIQPSNYLSTYKGVVMAFLTTYIESSFSSATDEGKTSLGDTFEFSAIKDYLRMILSSGEQFISQKKDFLSEILDSINKSISKGKKLIMDASNDSEMTGESEQDILHQINSITSSGEGKSMKRSQILKNLNQKSDYIFSELFTTLRTQKNSKRNESLYAELLYRYMEHCEYHRVGGLIRSLNTYYSKKQAKGVINYSDLKSPLVDEGVWNFCSYLKDLVNDIFGADKLHLVINILFLFYLNHNKYRSQGDQKTQKFQELKFEFFSHFISKFLINMNFLDQGTLKNASIITRTLVNGVKTMRGFLPSGPVKMKKMPEVKIAKALLRMGRRSTNIPTTVEESGSEEESASHLFVSEKEVKIRGLRFSLFYQLFLKQFLSDPSLINYINTAIMANEDDYLNSPLIKDLQDLMNAAFTFEIHLEKVQNFVNTKLKGTTSSTTFDKISKLCTVSVSMISNFIPLEIYPIYISEKLSISGQEGESGEEGGHQQPGIDFGTLQKFTQAFVDRIENSKISKSFKDFYSTAFNQFLGLLRFKSSSKEVDRSKFIQCFFISLALIHKKSSKFIEKLVQEYYSQLLGAIRRESNAVIKVGCMASLVQLTRNTNEYFIPILTDFVKEVTFCKFSLIKQFSEQKFQTYLDNYYIFYQERNISFIEDLKKSMEKLSKLPSLHSSYGHSQLAGNLLQVDQILATNMGDLIAPYFHLIFSTNLVLQNAAEGSSQQLQLLITTFTSKIELRNVLASYRKQMLYFDKEFVQKTSIQFVGQALYLSLRNASSEQILDCQKEIFDCIKRVYKYLSDNYENFESEFFDEQSSQIQDSFISFALKCSEKNLKPYFEKLLKWSKLLRSYGESETSSSLVKRIMFLKTFNAFAKKLGRFGVNYFGYLFDYFVAYLDNTAKHFQALEKAEQTGKRGSSSWSKLNEEIHVYLLESLEILFTNDKLDFVDSIKFERLLQPVSAQICLKGVTQDYKSFGEESLIPMYLALFKLLKDDFMLKTLQFNIFKGGVRNESIQVRIVSAKLLLKIVDHFADRYIILLNDVLPILSEMLDDEEAEVSLIARNIIKIVENTSGEDVYKMIKNTQLQVREGKRGQSKKAEDFTFGGRSKRIAGIFIG